MANTLKECNVDTNSKFVITIIIIIIIAVWKKTPGRSIRQLGLINKICVESSEACKTMCIDRLDCKSVDYVSQVRQHDTVFLHDS